MDTSEISSAFHLSLYSEALNLHRGAEISPRMAIIHPTNRCNHKCIGCEYASVHRNAEMLSSDRFLGLIDEVSKLGAASILFSGGGEPTLHPDFGRALEKVRQNQMLAGIFSNGAGVDQELAECIAQNAAFIRISVDAATAESYAAIRRVSQSQFERTLLAVKDLLAAKDRLGSEVQIGLKYLVRRTNIDEIAAFVNLAERLGVRSVQFKPLRGGPEEPSKEEMRQARQVIEEAKKKHSGFSIRGGMPNKQIRISASCWISPLRIVVSADGGVHLCNYFHHRRVTHTFGNIYRKPLTDIWFSDAHRQALNCIETSECQRYDCRFHKLNPKLLDLVQNHRKTLDFV